MNSKWNYFLSKTWICGLLCFILLMTQDIFLCAAESSSALLYKNDGSRTDIIGGAKAGLSAESVDAPYLGQGKAVHIYGSTPTLTYSSGIGYFSTGSTDSSAESIVLEMDICSNGGGLGVRMLQNDTETKNSIKFFQPDGTNYRRWYHVALQFDADGIGTNYTIWVGDQLREQGSMEDAGRGLTWLRLQPLSNNGDIYDVYMSNVKMYIGNYTPPLTPKVIVAEPLLLDEDSLRYTQDIGAEDVISAIAVQGGNCLGVYQADMNTLRNGNICDDDVVCIRGDEGIYVYYSLVFDDIDFVLTSEVYDIDQTSNCIMGIVRGSTVSTLVQNLHCTQGSILIRDVFGIQPEADEAVTESMQVLTYKGDDIQRIYTLKYAYQINWDFDRHMPRKENCINLRNTYVDMQKEGLSMLLSPNSEGECGLKKDVQFGDNCDVCDFSLYLSKRTEVILSLEDTMLFKVNENNTVLFFGETNAQYTWNRATWTSCTIIFNHKISRAELWIAGECRAEAEMNGWPNSGELKLLVSNTVDQNYVDDLLFYPVCDRDFAELQMISQNIEVSEEIALDFSNEELFHEFLKVNTSNGTGTATVQNGTLNITASAGGTPYVYTAKRKNLSKKTYISFSLNGDRLNNSNITVLLRDNNESTITGAIRFLKIGAGSITYLPDCSAVTVREDLPAGTSVFCAVFDHETDSVEIYRNGVCKFTTSVLSGLNDGRWRVFNWENVAPRFAFNASVTSDGNDSAVLEHIIITSKNLLGSTPIIFTPVYYDNGEILSFLTGNCVQYLTVYAPEDMIKPVRVYIPEYKDKKLIHVQCSNDVLLKSGECATVVTQIKPENSYSYFSCFIWDDDLVPYKDKADILRVSKVDPTLEERRIQTDVLHPYIAVKAGVFEELRKTTNLYRLSWSRKLLTDAQAVLNYDYNNPQITDENGNMADNSNYIGPETYDGIRYNAGDRMLSQVLKLAFAYRMQGDEQYAEAVWKRLEWTAAPYGTETETLFKDWNTSHFLDVAAMAYAYAIAYDWCYEYYTEEQKLRIENSLEQYAFIPYRTEFCKGAEANAVHNRNIVNNGGILLAAAAMFDRNPVYYGDIISTATDNMRYAVGSLNPDGGWFEGGNYWSYTVKYLIPAVQTMQTLYGTDFGFLDYDGMKETGYFPFAIQGPTGINDFHDSSASAALTNNSALFYLADAFSKLELNKAKLKAMDSNQNSVTVFDALWYNEETDLNTELPLNQYIEGIELVSLRSSLSDNDGAWVSFHGGITDGSHTHIDGGTFVFDYDGVRWASELPHENYNIGGYVSGTDSKNTYYRVRAEGHNTLVIDPDESPGQDTDSFVTVSDYDFNTNNPWAALDMTDAYKSKANKVTRRIMLKTAEASMQVEDLIELKKNSEIYWFMHTLADAEVNEDGKSVLLTKDGKTMELTIECDCETEVAVVPAERMDTSGTPYAGTESLNNGYRKVQILIHGEGSINLTVTLRPYQK